jgi:hypothetical protein
VLRTAGRESASVCVYGGGPTWRARLRARTRVLSVVLLRFSPV